jgi:hypothetical protein
MTCIIAKFLLFSIIPGLEDCINQEWLSVSPERDRN